ncbi:MAG: ADOP family duplicated permease [Gemmatimonadota bacterium]|nr:ADOP family duplicated permease [Gemmatimonadota bacterium]
MRGDSPPRLARRLLERVLLPGVVGESILGDLLAEYRSTRQAESRFRAGLRYWRQALSIAWRGRARVDPAAARLRRGLPGPGAWVSGVGGDLLHSLRAMRRRPQFFTAAVLTVALGTGATTTMFSVADGVLWRPLPYASPERLVLVGGTWPDGGLAPLTPPMFRDWARETRSFESLAGALRQQLDLVAEGEPKRFSAGAVSASLAPLLGVAPALGRWFAAAEDAPGSERVVVLGDLAWRTAWAADPAIIGRSVVLNERPHTVIGVMPPGFRPPEGLRIGETEMWLPLAHADIDLDSHDNAFVRALGRLAPGASAEAAHAELSSLSDRLIGGYPARGVYEDFEVSQVSLHRETVGDIGPTLLVFLGSVGLLLLIACANVAHLFLIRGTERRSELAVRAALGARGSRLARQLMTESLVVAASGGALGLALATLGVRAFSAWGPSGIPRAVEIGVDHRVLLFSLALATVTALAFGFAPARRAARVHPSAALKASGPGSGGGRTGRSRRLLVVAETGLTLVLLVGSGLLINTFVRLARVDPGFSTDGVIAMNLSLRSSYESRESRLQAYREIGERLAGVPGVAASGFSNGLPFGGGGSAGSLVVEGRVVDEDAPERYVGWQLVDDGYLSTLGVVAREGGLLTAADMRDGATRVLVNEAFASEFWPGERGVGRRLKIIRTGPEDPWLEVIGVIPDLNQGNLARAAAPEVYLPYTQPPFIFPRMTFVARAGAEGGSSALIPLMRQVVWDVDGAQPIDWVVPLEDRIAGSLVRPRFYALLLTTFATVALALALVGVYGTTAYSVGQRRRELAIRLALGASGGGVVRLVMRETCALLAIGILVGLASALGLSRVLGSLLYGVTGIDPATYGAVTLLLAFAAALAAYGPARRAGRRDPTVALRAN